MANLLRPKKLIMWAILGAICWGGYLFACYLWPTPERLAFKELSKNLAEIELKTEKDRLASFNEKVKSGERLTEAEKREAMEADKKIEKVRKDYSDGKLVPPPPKPASVKPKEEVIITKPVSNDLLTGAYLSWQKPDDYAGKKPEIREAVFEIKITRLDNEKLVFLDSNGKDTTDCTWKEKSQKYQGQWEKDGKVGFIEFTPIYENGKIVSFCGAMGSKNKKPNSFCWITGDIP